ncbi:MAG TPA: hypothetical protein DCW97_00845, partial [Acidobacteria bacterium]|nr:hypothetical protein [Acidobacteriota bacterium]
WLLAAKASGPAASIKRPKLPARMSLTLLLSLARPPELASATLNTCNSVLNFHLTEQVRVNV